MDWKARTGKVKLNAKQIKKLSNKVELGKPLTQTQTELLLNKVDELSLALRTVRLWVYRATECQPEEGNGSDEDLALIDRVCR